MKTKILILAGILAVVVISWYTSQSSPKMYRCVSGALVSDASQCPAFCGDENCVTGENCSSCPNDCGPCPYCGDRRCSHGETCESCVVDCGDCQLTKEEICSDTKLDIVYAFYFGGSESVELEYDIDTKLPNYSFDVEIMLLNDEIKHPSSVSFYRNEIIVPIEESYKENIEDIRISLRECPNVNAIAYINRAE